MPILKKTLPFLIFVFLLQNTSLAKDHIVKAYNHHNGQDMVFDPAFMHIQKGDRITFEVVDKNAGHNSQSIFTPDHAAAWNSPENKSFTHIFEQEGLYIYQCSTHAVMSMLGIIQVGKAHNLNAAKAFIEKNKSQWPIQSQRIDAYLKQAVTP
ncbi:plastocyanin/azurin family copper-binding protein [bacterium]|nr:plastocyanin/azurin family copper-binding protein [bacterium]